MNHQNIEIRNELRPGDIGYVTHMHGRIYGEEYNYGIEFEAYVAEGLAEFYRQYDTAKDRVWIAEDSEGMIGFMLLMNRGDAAQLRYFVIEKEHRGSGLGGRMMQMFMDTARELKYKSAYLWTAGGLDASAHLYRKHSFVLTEEKVTQSFGVTATEQRYAILL